MYKTKIKRFLIGLFIVNMSITGCFRGEISVDVKPNGSGVVSIAAGMTSQAKSMVYSQGGSLTQDIRDSLSGDGNISMTDIAVTTWREGDYEWSKAERKFKKLDEVNDLMMDREIFTRFLISRKSGLLQDEFILDAEFDKLNDEGSANEFGIDPSAFIEMKFSARLPGNIVETNGFVDINDPNRITWSAQGNQNVPIRARSVVVNWFNIIGMLCGSGIFLLLGVYALGGFDSFMRTRAKQQKRIDYLEDHSVSGVPSRPKPNYISELAIENLLSQVNTRALNSIGEIRKKRDEIALIWKDSQGKQSYIYVKDLGNDTISVNGNVYPAKLPNAKSAIIDALKKQQSN